MADRNEQVMEMVRREIERSPDVSLDILFDRAKEIDPSIGELTRRQFHARYPLQAKRNRSGGRARKGGRAAAADETASPPAARPPRGRGKRQQAQNRVAIRDLMLEFASDFAAAKSKAEVVGVLRNLEQYVTRMEALLDRGPARRNARKG